MNNKITVLYVEINNIGGSFYSLLDMIRSLGDAIHPIVLFPDENDSYHLMKSLGIECLAIPYTRLLLDSSFGGYIYCLPRYVRDYYRCDRNCLDIVLRYLNGRKIDVVHTNTSDSTIGYELAQALGAKHVWHIREQKDLVNHILLGSKRLRRKMSKSDARILISSSLKDSWRLKEDKTFVIGDAVRSVNDAVYNPQKDKYILFCSASLTKRKGAHHAVEAFGLSGLYKEGYKIYMLGACDDKMKMIIQTIINRYHLADAVKFFDKTNNVQPFYERASLYLMASESEGLSRTAIEAMFFGCPVLAHKTGGTTDFIFEGQTGYFYDSINDCASKMQIILKESQDEVIHRAQENVCANYSLEIYGDKILDVYKKVLEAK